MKKLNLEDFKTKAKAEILLLDEELIGGTQGNCHVKSSPTIPSNGTGTGPVGPA